MIRASNPAATANTEEPNPEHSPTDVAQAAAEALAGVVGTGVDAAVEGAVAQAVAEALAGAVVIETPAVLLLKTTTLGRVAMRGETL